MLVEMAIDSVRVSLMSQHRIVVLKDIASPRFLPIWIGPFEADAITIEMQGVEVTRPLTHDLLKSMIEKLGAQVERITITELRNDTFYAEIGLRADGRQLDVDSRPSDAIALAVRTQVPIFVSSDVLDQAGITPEPNLLADDEPRATGETTEGDAPEAFRDFLEGLDLSGLQ